MIFTPTPLGGSYLIDPAPHVDSRGWFMRTYSKDEFEQIDHRGEWVQMNHSCTAKKGALRGMHFQLPPYGEIKLVRCIRGTIFDVIVDIRKGSATFMHWFGAALSGDNKRMMYIPMGFAHGFQTLTEDCELIYLHSEKYTPGFEGGLRYDDPALAIAWPLAAIDLSERDQRHELISERFEGI